MPAGPWALNYENEVLNRYKLLIHPAQVFISNAGFIHKAAWESFTAFVPCKVQMLNLLLSTSYFSELFRRKTASCLQQDWVR